MFPHFLGIGAQKAGTSWLYRNLRDHPGVWMPPIKEIHYFDHPNPIPLLVQAYVTRSPSWRRRLRRQLRGGLRKMRRPSKRRVHLGWYMRYLALPRNDSWYASLFAPGAGQIAGEVTPIYACLDESVVAKIHALTPEARIIYLLRNPIDRAWSQGAMLFDRGYLEYQSLYTVPEHVILAFINNASNNVYENSDYVQALDVWGNYYAEEQIFVGFFDQLVESPAALLRDILRFLDLPAGDAYIPANVGRKVNARRYPPMSPQIKRQLARRQYENLEQLHRRFANRYTAAWLEDAREALKT